MIAIIFKQMGHFIDALAKNRCGERIDIHVGRPAVHKLFVELLDAMEDS
ncbi:hypothetical protein X566_20170 [Afipia sp. P52-10]|nr:hypothetical protein X566_20170 [Afipia sp. P52-10]